MKDSMTEPNHKSTSAPVPLSERVRSLRLDDADAPGAGSRGSWFPWLLVGVLACAAGLLALEAFAPIDDDMVKRLAKERGLDVATPETKGAGLDKLGVPSSSESATEIALESKGYIVPISLIQVSPKISGTVLHLKIEEGKRVTKGDTLAKLEAVEYQAEFDRSQAAVKAAKARVAELSRFRAEEILQVKAELDDAIAQREQAKSKFERVKNLKKMDAIAVEDFELAERESLSMDSRARRLKLAYELMQRGPRDEKIAAAQAEVKQAEADLDRAAWRLANTEVKAPIDGIILSKKTEEGNIVNPSAFSNGLSASLCEMADLFKMEVDLSIAERDVAKLFEKQDCRIRAEAFPNRIYAGYVSRIMPMADRSKASIPVRVRIRFPAVDSKGAPLAEEAQGEYLRPEMGAIVTFLNRKAD